MLFMKGASRKARVLVTIFATACIRLIGLKSLISSAPSFFEIRTMLALFRRFRSQLRLL
jgi:hypothetical protein